MTLTPMPSSLDLHPLHPLAPRSAFRCSECGGISYPPHQNPMGDCPYCGDNEDDDEA